MSMPFPAPGVGVSLGEVGLSMGPDVLRMPGGPLPADAADDGGLDAGQIALKTEAERRVAEWQDTGSSLVSSSFNDASAFFSTGLGAQYSHDAQISFMPGGVGADLIRDQLNIDPAMFINDIDTALGAAAENIYMIAQLELPRSEGEIVIQSPDPFVPPAINMNYYADPVDLDVMVATMRRSIDIAASWPGETKPGEWLVPPELARKHGHIAGQRPSDALLENTALHFSHTVYHVSCTCRIGSVVDPRLRVYGINNLRVADASVMPEITSGNINAVVIMIGERGAEIIAADHNI